MMELKETSGQTQLVTGSRMKKAPNGGRPKQLETALSISFHGTVRFLRNRANVRHLDGIKVLLKQQTCSFQENNGILKSRAKLIELLPYKASNM